ncbi:hypothetical protein M0G74_16125 [Microbulbifer sp. CAU 1566]|uniref:hypothetical protein n=1 Tax=Microbulbifer sp. CAU 1566 TaxID=2933269 RepID=UPI00200691EF|nr:hypothetical protein [Microbulbifer sp. CAU 1566]MCK7598802.1 hypothetical protein [Microbulbifer sp. CAU 1566]
MRTPEKLLFEGKVVAKLHNFSYETPWASASPEFLEASLGKKLENLAAFRVFDQDLEDKGLPDDKENVLWESKLSELGLSYPDLKLDKDGFWRVICSNGQAYEARSVSYSGGVLRWRA